MKFEYYNPGEVVCTVRSISKLLNKDYRIVEKELLELAKSLGYDSYNEIEVFEKYLYENGFVDTKKEYKERIKELSFDGENEVFCYDKKDFYHLVAIIDNVMYDKDEKNKELFVIKIYKKR